ncbi:MAG: hypothetical protein SP4CHLAM5_00470 [Chlamydiia bacterium]|nr:hypothetical protein [Chlamydiia bacterium]
MMTFSEIEQIFNRAFSKSFCRKKILFLFPILAACGVLTVFCRTLSIGVNHHVWMSLSFLPLFLSTGILLAAGVMLIKMYVFEIKGMDYKIGKLFVSSMQMVVGISYLCFPLILAYLVLWSVMGVFYLLKQVPAFGDIFGTLLSFGPYLLVLGSIALAIVSILLLFFITPHVALKKTLRMNIAAEVTQRMKKSIFANGVLLFTGMIPLTLVLFFLILGAVMTGASYFMPQDALAMGIRWLMMMLPFCMIVTPFVIFFFNFSLESYMLFKKRERETGNGSTSTLEKKKEEPCLV